ncbi:hypothetical protein AYI70_g7 [Smittium culicis]|uniref:Uncharacterized protein n=1 Tax=Smittium culicis TaxID=133412 RepID=A0A1R1YI78_9FUNG|nr:hypothetical protein AYI70_g7 [Smittium culicis]
MGTNTYIDHRQKYEYKKAIGVKRHTELSINKENIFDLKELYTRNCNQAENVTSTKKKIISDLKVKEIEKYHLYSTSRNGFLSPEIGIEEHEYLIDKSTCLNSFEDLRYVDTDPEITVVEEFVTINKKKSGNTTENMYKANNDFGSLNISSKACDEVNASRFEMKAVEIETDNNNLNLPNELEDCATYIDSEIGTSENTLKLYHESGIELDQDLENYIEPNEYINPISGTSLSIKAQLDIYVNDIIKFMESDLEGFAFESY